MTGQFSFARTDEGQDTSFYLKMANRHGLISGATGTGKTITLQVLAEAFSKNGVPVFLSDVKGDLSGLAKACPPGSKAFSRVEKLKLTQFQPRVFPTVLWDVYGKRGLPLRTTVSEMGPIMFSRLLNLNNTQESVLHLIFKIADDEGLLLLDLKDLQSVMAWIGEKTSDLKSKYGQIHTSTLSTIQRQIFILNEAGGRIFFGEPAINIHHLMQTDFSGLGLINILDATTLFQDPRMYSTFMLSMLSDLFEDLDEVGDREKPRLVFFFDEAHLLFRGCPQFLQDKIEQVVRLIRSKGVGVFFVTQNPLDLPAPVLGQLGLKVQHALRAFTPAEQKAVKAAAQAFRENPTIDTETAMTELGIGEALVSTLDDEGKPTQVERVYIYPPESQMGPIEDTERAQKIMNSPLASQYQNDVDRESAYEILAKRAQEKMAEQNQIDQTRNAPSKARQGQSIGDAFVKSTVRTIGYAVGREIVRGVLGSILGKRRR
ncbi:MAG: DUF853 family protein [Bdellovibrionales bacterium]|nr:DUF853 family protein [Bdellovibrionales bacterium]